MGGVSEPTPSGKGGRKSLNVELNLVPFIDLLTVCITFLLLTAVWTHTGRINIDQSVQKPLKRQEQKEPPKRLIVLVDKKGYTVKWADEQPTTLPMAGDEYDVGALKKHVKTLEDRLPKNPRVVVALADDIRYNELIRVLDAFMGMHMPNVMVADAASVASQLM